MKNIRKNVVVLLGLVAAPLAAQQDAVMPEEIFQDRIGVEIVNIDVSVTDKKGRAVGGLTREDFELRIDGQEVSIANFYAVSYRETPAETSNSGSPRAAAKATLFDPAAERLHVMVYVDGFYLTPQSRKRVLEDLPDFFQAQLAAGGRIMLVTHDQTARALTPFTDNLDELLKGLETIAASPATGIQQRTNRTLVFNNIRQTYEICAESSRLDPCEDCLAQMIELIRFYAAGVLSERRAAMDSIRSFVNALAVLDGKKALLHLSDGIEQQAGIDLFYFLGEQICPQKRHEFQQYYVRQDVDDLNDLVNQANASRVTFFTLEAAGLRSFSAASAEFQDNLFRPDGTNDMLRFANLQGTLHFLAEETGGKAILNANDFAPDLEKLTGEFRTYYALGYQPAHAGRGRSHRVSVSIPKNKGYEVRYRRSFLHKKPEQQLADRALGAVIFDVTENPLGVAVQATGHGAGTEGRVQVTLDFSVPLDKLTLIPQQGARHGRLMAIVAAPGEKEMSIRSKEIDIVLPGESAGDGAATHHRFGVNVELAPGDYRLGAGVWDEVAAEGSFLAVPVKVTVPPETEPQPTETAEPEPVSEPEPEPEG